MEDDQSGQLESECVRARAGAGEGHGSGYHLYRRSMQDREIRNQGLSSEIDETTCYYNCRHGRGLVLVLLGLVTGVSELAAQSVAGIKCQSGRRRFSVHECGLPDSQLHQLTLQLRAADGRR